MQVDLSKTEERLEEGYTRLPSLTNQNLQNNTNDLVIKN